MKYFIREHSFIARLAAKKLRASRVAIVIGKTIYLHNTSKEAFLKDPCWVTHELVHIKQFQQYGYMTFIIKYLWESMKNGYVNNKYEVEARAAENDSNARDEMLI